MILLWKKYEKSFDEIRSNVLKEIEKYDKIVITIQVMFVFSGYRQGEL